MKRVVPGFILGAMLMLGLVQPALAAGGGLGAFTPRLAATCGGDQITLSFPLIRGQNCVDKDRAILAYLEMILQLLSYGIGVIILLMLSISGIQYITSAGDPGQIKSAKDRIVNAVTALVLWIFGYAILSFIIPGGP